MEDIVLTSEKPLTTIASAANRIICHVCQKQFSQYTCPRCNSRYCSVNCYKSHSVRCTESFMKENVVEEMRHMQPDDETKQKMLNILKRFHSEEEDIDSMDEDDDSTLSEETIQKILSGNLANLDDLSPEEMKRFQRAMASGELSKLIDPWEPWWLKPSARIISLSVEGAQLIQPIQRDSTENDHSTDIPSGPETPLPPLNKLSSLQPSPLLDVHLVDVVYSYCFTLRLYNGDWQSDALGASMVVLSLSGILGEGGQPETVSGALGHCLEQTCSPAYRHSGGLQFGLALIDDVISLLSLGRPALICLLCDLQHLIQAGKKELKLEKPRKLNRKGEIQSKLKHADRKVYFLMCWVNEQPNEAWSALAAIVGMEQKSMGAMYHGDGRKPVHASGKESKSKVLIQEVE